MRKFVLKKLYRLFPFDLTGDCNIPEKAGDIRISCVINFYGRLDLLTGILCSLAEQQYPRTLFEVILIEDRGGTEEGRRTAESFSDRLQIVYLQLDDNFGEMGYSRNFGLSRTKGEIVLFLDDDTVILRNDFLSILDSEFASDINADAVVPNGSASFACIEDRYDFHEPYFMTSRCTAYRRDVLRELGGFINNFVGQEDVEFVTRFTIAGKKAKNSPKLKYYHPPLLVPNTRKPRSVGFSFYGLKQRYSLVIWLLLMANCSRHAPLVILPKRRFKEQGRFGIGFIAGIWDGIKGCKEQSYG